jgi:hypothetical protein
MEAAKMAVKKKQRSCDLLLNAVEDRWLEVYEALLGPCERIAAGERWWHAPWRRDAHASMRVNQAGLWYDDPTGEGGNVFMLYARMKGLQLPREFNRAKMELAEMLGLLGIPSSQWPEPRAGNPDAARRTRGKLGTPEATEPEPDFAPDCDPDAILTAAPRMGVTLEETWQDPSNHTMPTPGDMARNYGLTWADFLHHGCTLVNSIYGATGRRMRGVVYPVVGIDGKLHYKAKSLGRYTPDSFNNRQLQGGNCAPWPGGTRLSYHPGGGCGFFPARQLRGAGTLVLTAGEEKALAAIATGWRAVSWSAGECSIHDRVARFLAAMGNTSVLVAMDADAAGCQGATKAAEALQRAGCTDVRVLRWPQKRPMRWDMADELRVHGAQCLDELLRDGQPYTSELAQVLDIHPAHDTAAAEDAPAAPQPDTTNGNTTAEPDHDETNNNGTPDHNETENGETNMEIIDVKPAQDRTGEAPVELEDATAPAFPVQAVSHIPWLHNWVTALAEAYQTPVDLPAVLTLGAIAGAMQRRVMVSPREGWSEPINLYSIVALPPGTNKSQVHREVLAPIVKWETERNEASENERGRLEIVANMLELRIEKLKKRAASEATDAETRDEMSREVFALQQELNALPPRTPLQLVFDDTTAEALERAMSTSGQAIVASAEGKLFDNMAGAYSRVPNLNIYLKAHAGDPVAVNRIGRDRVIIHDPRLTLLMSVQPQVIEGLSTRKEFDGRGLLARMLYSLPEANIGYRKEDPEPVSEDVRFEYHAAMHYLLEYGNPAELPEGDDGTPRVLRLDPAADRLFRYMRQEIEQRLSPDVNDLGGMGGWANKLAGLVARLAAVLHCALKVREPWATPIGQHTMESAIAISRYAIEHARAAFHVMSAHPDTSNATYLRDVLLRTAREKNTNTVARLQAWQATKRRLQTAAAFDRALQMLESHAYLEVKATPPGANGRPGKWLQLNPHWTGVTPPPRKCQSQAFVHDSCPGW